MGHLLKNFLLLTSLLLYGLLPAAQRQYAGASVLASGQWAKIATDRPGIYKIDVSFLNTLGFSGALPSAQIRLFGRPGGMLPEGNGTPYTDDLQELALEVADGGDGVLNGSDYILFYAPGPHLWVADPVNKTFRHQKNLYSEKCFFFLSVGGTGKRVTTQQWAQNPATTVTHFNERYFHELDSVNFLSSGKEWFGEEFSGAPGRTLQHSFNLPFSDLDIAQPVTIATHVVARSVGNSSAFTVQTGGQVVQQLRVPPVNGLPYNLFAQQVVESATFFAPMQSVSLSFSFSPGGFNAQGWLNWFEVHGRRPLALGSGQQLLFRDWNSVGQAAVQFGIGTPLARTQVWEVTDALAPVKIPVTFNNGQAAFTSNADRLREYVAFSSTFYTPEAVGRIAPQNLHGTAEADYFIITHEAFLAQAQRLAQFHQQQNGLRTVVVTTAQIFNEFSGGQPDPTALKDFLKMYYDRYRATWAARPKYLLLFGKASFDYKVRVQHNTNFVPAYQSMASLDPLATYTSDDFFGFLDDAEDINAVLVHNRLDIGIGRVPVTTPQEAKQFVDKVESYHSAATLGPWRNSLTFIADDEDNNLHLQDAEVVTATAAATAPAFNQHKIYLDAFKQEGGSAGGRYPQANTTINNLVYNGTLIWNYSGHGGPLRLAEEVVLDAQTVNNWNNEYKLPLLITATCDFAPYDNPFLQSLGEAILVRPKTGAIALMTTTRVVFANSNRVMNDNYLRFALQKVDGRYRSLGEAVQTAKNHTYQTSADLVNNRKFALLGDPALTLAYPQLQVVPAAINGKVVSAQQDTLGATDAVTITGAVQSHTGAVQSDFNGTVYLTVFDKPQSITTLGNDGGSQPVTFQAQQAVLFKGKVTAQAGLFTFQFRLPKDINYQYGFGKLSFYAEDGRRDGNGYYDSLLIGGMGSGGSGDSEGPEIKAYLDDEQFVNGSIIHPAPVLLVKLADSSGINTGNSIDHDIVATLDDDARTYYVLNAFYETELDNYRKGSIRFQLPPLPPGAHTLTIKAWDAANNSSVYQLRFTVVESTEMVIDHVLNYPNPFTTQTQFWFEHNQPQSTLQVKVEIYTISGKLINTLSRTINTTGNRSNEVVWDGRDQYGAKAGRGVYIYRLQVTNSSGKRAEKWEKLALLN